jgi:hypothetical protein
VVYVVVGYPRIFISYAEAIPMTEGGCELALEEICKYKRNIYANVLMKGLIERGWIEVDRDIVRYKLPGILFQ